MFRRLLLIASAMCSLLMAQTQTYILCEGNYNSLNSSLWSLNSDFTNINGPIYWNQSNNPLGDTGQSLKIHNNKLYIVMNNSNTIEIADISNGFQYEASINIPNAGPRDIEIINNIAYVSCWYLNGILCINLDDYSFIDTLVCNGLPEDLLYYNDKLYSSITMNPDWSSSDKVIEFDLSTGVPFVSNTFTVITGPEELVAFQNSIYVSSTYYDDAWNTYAGNSKIDLTTKEVTTKDFGITFSFGRDVTVLNNKVYRVYNNGICSLSDSLTMNLDDQIGNYSTIYSMASYNDLIYFGLSDYTAPDNVVILNSHGNEIKNFQVGAIPGSFAFFESNSTMVNNNNTTLLDFNLFHNYPNPFNGATNFTYNILESGQVTLSIYNSTGQHIINLIDSIKAAGSYSIVWNGFNKSGIPVSNGIYFAVLKTAHECSRIKILYLK